MGARTSAPHVPVRSCANSQTPPPRFRSWWPASLLEVVSTALASGFLPVLCLCGFSPACRAPSTCAVCRCCLLDLATPPRSRSVFGVSLQRLLCWMLSFKARALPRQRECLVSVWWFLELRSVPQVARECHRPPQEGNL